MNKPIITIAVVSLLATLSLGLIVRKAQSVNIKVEPVVVVPEEVKPKDPKELAVEIADEYKVSAPLVVELINLENVEWDTTLQSRVRYAKDNLKWGVKAGEREKSFGLAQIHLPDHPEIKYEQATSAEYAIRFIAKEISEGRGGQWSCYRTAKYNLANGKSGGKCTL